MRFFEKKHIFIVKVYYETKSYVTVQTRFHDEYPYCEMFPKISIKRLVDKFERTGSLHDAKGEDERML